MQLQEIIKQYLSSTKTHMMQLATTRDDQPWICNVWFAADEDLNIYWFSSTTRQHSHEIAENPKVAASICEPQSSEDDAVAIQLEGAAHQLTDPADIAKARSVYEGRIFAAEKIDEMMSNPEKPHSFYRIEPTRIVLFDVVHFPGKPQQEWRP